jgi:cytochrome c553
MSKILSSILGWLVFIGRKLMKVVQGVKSLLGPAPGWTGMKRWLLQITILGMLVGMSVFLVLTLGLVPIKASSGHWPITAWFLKHAMNRSVSTQALGIKAPALDNPGMVLKGATHYELGCFPCHGNPAIRNPRIASKMIPPPPYLPPIIAEWDPEELFYIVKHGVKFTGMPAWPSEQRDDEVWAIVAFLEKFPDLNEQEYWRMVSGLPDETTGKNVPLQALDSRASIAESLNVRCGRCHGGDGQGRDADVAPKLAGQRPEYLEASLKAYAQGERHSGIMEPIAVGLSGQEIDEVAQYYGRLAASQLTQRPPETDLAISRGATIAREGIPKVRIPICSECHGPSDNHLNSAYPILAGQYAEYLVLQLELFANERRGGSEFGPLMHEIAEHLTPQERRDVALYYQSLAGSSLPSD